MPKNSCIDKEQFEQFCAYQMKEKDIANFFGVDRTAINNFCKKNYNLSFSSYLAQKKTESKSILIDNALKLAEKNATMCIFLLKNWCGYTDVPNDSDNSNAELIEAFSKWANNDKQTNAEAK